MHTEIYVVHGTSVANVFPWYYSPGGSGNQAANLAISNGYVTTNSYRIDATS